MNVPFKNSSNLHPTNKNTINTVLTTNFDLTINISWNSLEGILY